LELCRPFKSTNPVMGGTCTWGRIKSGSGIHYGDGKIFPGTFDAYQMALDAKKGTVLWETETTGAMAFSGSYYQDKFFRGGPDNQFYAFNAMTGEVLWIFNPGTEFGSWNVGSAVAYGKVYQVNTDGHLYAIDTDTGQLVWKYKGPGHIFIAGHPVVADGKVYATTGQASSSDPHTGEPSNSEFVCLDAYTGDLLWKLPIEAHAPRESVAIAYGNLYIIPGYIQDRMDIYETPNEVWAIGSKSWPMWRQNSANTGAGQSGPTDLAVRWKFTTGGAVISSPTIVNGKVYVGSNDKNLYCIDALTGAQMWNFTTGARIKSSPAVIDGKVFIGPDDGYIYSLDAKTGNIIWTQTAGGYIEAHLDAISRLRSSPTVVGDRVYVGSLDTKLYSLNANSGDVIWSYKTEGYITSSPAVLDDAVYFTSQEPKSAVLYKLTADNGSLVWKLEIPYVLFAERGTDVHASPLVLKDMVFAYSNKLHYYGINATNGSIKWNYTAVFENFLVGSVAYYDGKLFLIDQFFLVAIEAENGIPIWKSWIGSELYSSPIYADGKVYITTDRHAIYVLNATTGESFHGSKQALKSGHPHQYTKGGYMLEAMTGTSIAL
jgi:eukaryotic-like serine/threonine-protein kinase